MDIQEQIKEIQDSIEKATETSSLLAARRFDSTSAMLKTIEARALLQRASSKFAEIADMELYLKNHGGE